MVSDSLINKLFQSFEELDRCISMTESVLRDKNDVPTDVLSRVSQYGGIVDKQRTLAQELQTKIVEQDWEEVTRLVKIINGLSAMIRDDAQALLAGAYRRNDELTHKPDLSSLC